MSRPKAVGVYGKAEFQADFFRLQAGEFSQAGLDRWFEEGLQTMRMEGGALPEGPVAFLLAPRSATRVFLGSFAPSTDAAGRSFPLVIFAEIDSLTSLDTLSTLLVQAGPFLSTAGALAVEGGKLSEPELVERVQALSSPDIESGVTGEADSDPAHEPANALVIALGGTPRALGYALRTIGLACDQASKYGPDAGSGVITIDAPTPTRLVRQLWLKLIQRRLRWREGLPSLLWTEPSMDQVGRTLLTLGPPASSVFGYLANPRHRSPRFWPLRTDVNAALDQALQSLAPEQRRLIENPSVSLGELVTAFGS